MKFNTKVGLQLAHQGVYDRRSLAALQDLYGRKLESQPTVNPIRGLFFLQMTDEPTEKGRKFEQIRASRSLPTFFLLRQNVGYLLPTFSSDIRLSRPPATRRDVRVDVDANVNVVKEQKIAVARRSPLNPQQRFVHSLEQGRSLLSTLP